MQTKLMIRILVVGLLALLISPAVFAQERTKKLPPQKPSKDLERTDPRRGMKPPSGPSFYIAPVEGSQSMFTVLMGDGAGKSVAGTFTLQQVVVFEAVLQAAEAFALTDEKVGSGKPITTRLMEQHEWSLFVDVSKIGNQSRFYVSLITPQGKLTADAGEITRGSKKETSAPLLLNILSQVQAVKAGITPQQ
jgi:hypothetical protein